MLQLRNYLEGTGLYAPKDPTTTDGSLSHLFECLLYYNTGPPGKRGPKGSRGPRGPAGRSGGVTGGAVYTRWGRKACPKTSKTTQLYSGKKVEKIFT